MEVIDEKDQSQVLSAQLGTKSTAKDMQNETTLNKAHHFKRPRSCRSASASFSLIAISFVIATTTAFAQSTKGGGNQPGQRLQQTTTTTAATTSSNLANSYSGNAIQSPASQLRQQQQQVGYQVPSQTAKAVSAPTKRHPQPPVQQQQQLPSLTENYRENRFQAQHQQQAATTEDPLADSEPALYGSVAGAPGVDFPAYTQIPKTSFTCEGKGFDFGFYADEEAQCQVYHVCWSGRRESFLCGVGTVFNQAILACDYWHSVDCSKTSQFYGVNSELGKASAEPATGQQQQQQRQRAISPANLPRRTGGSSGQSQYGDQQQQQQQQVSISDASNGFGEPLSQRRITQQQTYSNDDTSFEAHQQPTRASTYSSGQASGSGNTGFVPQRSTQQQSTGGPYEQQQQRIESPSQGAKGAQWTQSFSTTPASVTAPPSSRINMDYNQKVNSLIESPVRAPLSKTSPSKRPVVSSAPPLAPVATKTSVTTTRRPFQQQQQVSNGNFAQLAVARAQQKSASRTPERKSVQQQQQYAPVQQQQQRVQEQQQFDADLDEPQQQQSNFDDSPVQTSTAPAISQQRVYQSRQNNNFAPQQQQMVIQSGGNSPDGSSAITTQYDTMSPAIGQFSQQQQQQQTGDSNQDQNYESALDDSQSGANDDFRSSGAKAAASQNQNWYIMRTI